MWRNLNPADEGTPAVTQRFHNATHCSRLAAIALLCCYPAAGAAAQEPIWDDAPTTIQAILALDIPGGSLQKLAETLPAYLAQRAVAAVGPAWNLDAKVATGALRQQVLKQLASPGDKPPDAFPTDGDKLLLLAVRRTADGYELTGREYDRLVERWGMPVTRECRQQQALAEQLFALVWQVVAPVTQLEIDAKDPQRVVLRPRGGMFPLAGDGMQWAKPGDVFLPVLRRTTRGGQLMKDGIQAVPWTFIEVTEVDGSKIVGRIHSGSRRPFGGRRRGRVEEVAIALRADPANTVLKLRSRVKAEKPLVGYEVFAKNTDDESTTPIGASDVAGRIEVPPGRTRLQLLYLKNGGELLARLPVVPGAELLIEAPLPDDDARLEAEAQLAAMREDLIDVVVRRNILMARTKQKIEKKDWEQARELLRVLDELPGRAQFDLELSKQARLVRSDDPQIQKRIDRLVEGMQAVLGKFLDNRPVSQLHDELRAAQRAAADAQKTPANQAPSAAPAANSAADQTSVFRQLRRGAATTDDRDA
jgi:hypothetical protein